MLSVRPIEHSDIAPLSAYWLQSDEKYMQALGVDLQKMPSKQEWEAMLLEQIASPIAQKKSFAIIWLLNNKAVGHCNINKIIIGQEAYLHLHIWDEKARQKGYGLAWLKQSLPYFFEQFQLKELYSEPYSLNIAPNKTLEKAGFTFIKQYTTTPGWINYEQSVCLWNMSKAEYERLYQ